MRHTTWMRLQALPYWTDVYGHYRKLPGAIRTPIRILTLPHWQLATYMVRSAARNRVVAGPFRGMKLELSPLSKSHHLGYLLGSQEMELRPLIEKTISRGYGTILNVGAADGYYAVGLAMRLPDARVIAYEALPEMHPVILRAARENNVAGRISLAGRCGIADLQCGLEAATAPVLVFMDIEGGECELLDPRAAPALRTADIVVEMHDCFVPNATETVLSRFTATHDVEHVTSRPRTINDFPPGFLTMMTKFAPQLSVDLMDERRPATQGWLYMKSRLS
jgi:predicted O-methyltransferase YrrM